MTTQQRSWKDWAVDHLLKTGMCVGDTPSTGLPDEKMTEEQFKMTVGRVHLAENCSHFMDERMGIPVRQDLKEIKGIDAAPITEEDLTRGKKTFLKGGTPLNAVDRFKRDLHTYVDLIEIKEGGRLVVPHQLMKFEVFLREFFDVKG